MEEKVRYQYSYFIYPFTTKNYENYLYSLLKNKNITIEFFEKEKEMELYTYFLPKVRNYFFSSMDWDKEQKKQFEALEDEQKRDALAKMGACCFSYQMQAPIYGKVGEGDIFFTIDTIQMICTKPSCFLLLKTHIENVETAEQVLDFNYKFREMNTLSEELKNYEKIHIQTTQFESTKEIQTLIQELTKQDNISLPYIHSYLCLDSECWNQVEDFSKLQVTYQKYRNIQPKSRNSSIQEENVTILDGDYVKIVSNKHGNFLIASSIQNENYTKLPYYFEKQYLYTYLIRLQQKQVLQESFDKVVEQQIWEAILARDEVTEESLGEKLYQAHREIWNMDELEERAKHYQEIQMDKAEITKNKKWNRILIIVLGVSIVLNIINLVMNLSLR